MARLAPVLAVLVPLLAACGQTGPLYLEPEPAAAAPGAPPSGPAADPSPAEPLPEADSSPAP